MQKELEHQLTKLDKQLELLRYERKKVYRKLWRLNNLPYVPKDRRGRPKGYSVKLGRYYTETELKEIEFKKNNPNPRGRPLGWRKSLVAQ